MRTFSRSHTHPWLAPLTLVLGAALLFGLFGCSGEPDDDGGGSDTAGGDTALDTSGGDLTDSGDADPDTTPVECTAPALECDGDPATVCETDTSSSPQHCGACGFTCSSAEVCSGGTCTTECAGGETNCGGACADLTSSTSHCGDCDSPCASGQSCNAGVCELVCESGTVACDGACVSASTVENCGGCNNACTPPANADATCESETCGFACQAGFDDCDANEDNGCETELATSDEHCGACGTVCGAVAHGTSTCSEAACVVDACDQGYADVDGDVANGCEFQFVQMVALSGEPAPTLGGRAGVADVGATTRLVVGEGGVGTKLWTSNVGGGSAQSVSVPELLSASTNAGAGSGQWAVVADPDQMALAIQNPTLTRFPYTHTYCSGCTGTPLMEAFSSPPAFEIAPVVLGSDGRLQWLALATGGNTPYGTAPCSGEPDVWMLCHVDEVADVATFDLIAGTASLVALVDTGAATYHAAVYALNVSGRRIDLATQLGLVDTRVTKAPGTRVAFVPGDDTLNPAFVIVSGRELKVLRFDSTILSGSWSEAGTATLPHDIVDVVALDARHLLIGADTGDGSAAYVAVSERTSPGTLDAPVLVWEDTGTLRHIMVDPNDPSVVLLQRLSFLEGFTWSITP